VKDAKCTTLPVKVNLTIKVGVNVALHSVAFAYYHVTNIVIFSISQKYFSYLCKIV
jgi:hypothetical protein